MARARPSSPPDPLDRLIGAAPALQTLRAQIGYLARFDAVGHAAVPTVLLQGETGTGKGLVARVMHDSGPRASGPFIDVNCTAIPDTLLEAEMFGVEAGAFTDAKRTKPGLFEAASEGTLFLDEIDALPLALQGKCLTAIESKRVRRVGAVVDHAIDVKLIAATQVELSEQVRAGRFRPDLFHRLAVVVLELPPLRERGEDILVLARAFLQQYAVAYGVSPQRLSKAAESWLLGYPWPGNVRELSHLLERVVLLEEATVIDPESLARRCLPPLGPAVPDGSGHLPRPDVSLNEAERLTEALRQSGGNLAAAARLLGMSRGGLRYRLHRYGLTRSSLTQGLPMAREETSRRVMPTSSTPTLDPAVEEEPPVVPSPQGGEGQREGESARRDEPHLVLTGRGNPAPTACWVPKPVAVLAIEATWPDMLAAEAGHYEPWTVASHWEQRVTEMVVAFGGVILEGSASLLLAAFGLPQTLEQLPQRAVQAALALRYLAAEGQTSYGQAAGPTVRLAGHVGTLLVAEETAESPRRWLAMGETLSLPVRLLGHAAPGELLVSPPMARLIDGWVEVQTRPLSSGAESSEPLLVHTVVGFPPRHAARAGIGRRVRTPLLGRAHELATLQMVLARVESGRGQVVGIVGEPGMGKSRLLAEWRQSLAARQATYLEGHCWSYGNATPYLPVLDLLRAQCDITPIDNTETMTEKVRKGLQTVGMITEEWVPYLLHLLGLATGTERLADVSPEVLKANNFEALRQLSLHRSQQHPLVITVENLHWIDPTSEAFFASLVERLPAASILFLTTYRPGYRPPWLDKSYATQLTLAPLSPQDSVQVVRAVLEAETVPDPLAQSILARAQGNPFFLEEIAQTVVEQTTRRRQSGMALPPLLQLPATVQEVLGARIDRLPADEKALLQTLAVMGPRCARRLLVQIVAKPDAEVTRRLTNLQAAELLHDQPAGSESTYTFKHVLTQEVAYNSLSPALRRVLHERTAQAIEELAGDRLAERYGELAHHYRRSGNTQRAVVYLQRAGQQAADRSAYREAITHLTQGVEQLQHLPNTPARMRQELDCHITLAQALSVTRGQTAVGAEQAYLRAYALCEQLGDTPQQLVVLGGLRTMYEVRGDLLKARELAQQLLRLAQRESDPARLMRAYISAGNTSFQLGEFAPAREYLDQALALEDPRWDTAAVVRLSNQIPGASSRRVAALTLWFLGYPAQALRRNQEAIALAQALAHPYSLAYALHQVAILHGLRGEAQAAHTHAEALIALAEQQEFPQMVARGMFSRGWALAAQGQDLEGIAQMRQGLEAQRTLGVEVPPPHRLVLLAEGLASIRKHGGSYYKAEVHRLTGEIQLMSEMDRGVSASPPPELPMINGHEGEASVQLPPQTDPESWFQQALDIARRQQAKSLELRAAMSLSRLWHQQGKHTEAYRLLAPIYGWFTEGFDTADLRDTKALLDALV